MWLTNLKIAIIEKNTDALSDLLDDIPELSKADDIETAVYLLREAVELLHTLQDETELSMGKIKKNLAFYVQLKSKVQKKLDIKS